MLWTDGDFVTAADLATLDQEVQAVATAENIDITNSIRRATEEAGETITRHMREWGWSWLGDGSVSPNHYAAVANIGRNAQGTRARVLLNQIPVTGLAGWSAVQRWAAYWSLYVFFRDAAQRSVSDRYAQKSMVYQAETHGRMWHTVRDLGLPVVRTPLACPGAKYDINPGTWDQSNVTLVNGSGTLTGAWDVAITYVDADNQTDNNQSAASARVQVTLQAGKVLRVDKSSLNPPNGTQPSQLRAVAVVQSWGKATHWNVWAGPAGGVLRLQNATPLTGNTFTFPGDPVTNTAPVGTGQWADVYIAFPVPVQRG